MQPTKYTIKKDGRKYELYRDGAREAHEFEDKESILYLIWVMEGAKPSINYYAVPDENYETFIVYKVSNTPYCGRCIY